MSCATGEAFVSSMQRGDGSKGVRRRTGTNCFTVIFRRFVCMLWSPKPQHGQGWIPQAICSDRVSFMPHKPQGLVHHFWLRQHPAPSTAGHLCDVTRHQPAQEEELRKETTCRFVVSSCYTNVKARAAIRSDLLWGWLPCTPRVG